MSSQVRISLTWWGKQWAALALAGAAFFSPVQAAEAPLLQRFKIATIAAPDLAVVERDYERWLDYRVRERGIVDLGLATSWGAPKVAGRAYSLMSPDSAPDVFLRAVQSPPQPAYRFLTTYGWNAIEIVVDDPDQLFAEMRGSPFEVIGEPAALPTIPSVKAFQVVGSAQEVLYLTAETGDRSKSVLPDPRGRIGRIFIMVLAATHPRHTLDWYAEKFSLRPGALRARPNEMINRAQNIAAGTALPIATARLAEHGNLIEFDGYSANATLRQTLPGELPPGVAMTSFSVTNLDVFDLEWISPPAVRAGVGYAGRRAATTRGPDGELIELIEE